MTTVQSFYPNVNKIPISMVSSQKYVGFAII